MKRDWLDVAMNTAIVLALGIVAVLVFFTVAGDYIVAAGVMQ